ncbi:phosphate ABC transporter permease subunit PstC [Mucilaginibacter sp.]|jgi:phosphate transport system permease protein|uniref:phosphate ABC transporter permease subunit PstC n=1 Tax=Mucilaginibacter sp. TaxID=1882438 RepID=UPI002CD50AD9|nr:phosphate ABC transporter permease subunit PstC [Mucilaginibacter sp.]HTI61513.1 phosphate ABC transporter permease subunit PstC [Mucilaginibacter sp.]
MQFRLIKDKVYSKLMLGLTVLSVSVVLVVGIGLYLKSGPVLEHSSWWTLLSSSQWKPLKGLFGFFSFIMGTLWVTAIAIIIALPLCLLTSFYITEYAPNRVRKILVPFVNLLSGIPPVIFGVWGVLFIIPLIQNHIAPHFVEFSTGYSVLAGGIVLAVMIFPLIVSIVCEVLNTIPRELKDASLALGATKWETIKKVQLRKAKPGIIAATVLAISRAFGETIAVLMVCGNNAVTPHSVFDPGYPLPALIANNYGEMLSIPMYESALMFAALLLFIIILLFNIISRVVLARLERKLAL